MKTRWVNGAVALGFGMLLVLSLKLGCTPQQRAELAVDLSKIGACVLTSIAEGGIDDPSIIQDRCEGSTFDIIGSVVKEWLTASAAQPDAAHLVAASPLHVRFEMVLQRVFARLDGGSP